VEALRGLGWRVNDEVEYPEAKAEAETIVSSIRSGATLERAVLTVEGRDLLVAAPYRFRSNLEIVGGEWDKARSARRYRNVTRGQAEAIQLILKGIIVERQGDWEALERAWAEEERARSLLEAAELPDVPGLKTTPWHHQKRGVYFLMNLLKTGKPGGMLAFDMGAGKTLTAIGFANAAGFRRVLIGAPRSVVSNWAREFGLHSATEWEAVGLNHKVGSVNDKLEEAKTAVARAQASGKPLAIAINYESMVREPMSEWLLGQKWDLLILDESHKLKAPDGQRAKFMAKLAERATFRLALTGTPMPHSPLDIWAQYRIVDSSVYGSSFFAFQKRYAEKNQWGGVSGFKNLDDLNKRFYSRALRVTKAEAIDLPAEQHIRREVELGAKARRHYDELIKELQTELTSGKITVDNALVKLLRTQQLTEKGLGGKPTVSTVGCRTQAAQRAAAAKPWSSTSCRLSQVLLDSERGYGNPHPQAPLPQAQ